MTCKHCGKEHPRQSAYCSIECAEAFFWATCRAKSRAYAAKAKAAREAAPGYAEEQARKKAAQQARAAARAVEVQERKRAREAYLQTPEGQEERKAARNAYTKIRLADPEYRAARNAYYRQRRQRPEVKAWYKAYWTSSHGKEIVKAAQAKRQAALKAPGAERISRTAVCERDNWICGICHQPVDSTLKHPHPMSATTDHIVPLSVGGPHTYANIQLAHLRCNASKGKRSEPVLLQMSG